jgi:hypothetical protein
MFGPVLAVLTALGIGGIAGGWLAARRERAETFRQRMVETCIEFLQKQAAARAGLADTQAEVLDSMFSAPTVLLDTAARRDQLATATTPLREFQTQSFLLDLFFPRSEEEVASSFAANVVVLYWRWHELLNDTLKGELGVEGLREAVQRITTEANEQHQRFCWAANRAIRGRTF